jgi:hypothetical protein
MKYCALLQPSTSVINNSLFALVTAISMTDQVYRGMGQKVCLIDRSGSGVVASTIVEPVH